MINEYITEKMTVEKDKSDGITVGQPHLAKQVRIKFKIFTLKKLYPPLEKYSPPPPNVVGKDV